MNKVITKRIQDSINVKAALLGNEELLNIVDSLVNEIVKSIKCGKKLVLCGNGGSASDALHFAGEIVGRFQKDRVAWSAVVLNSDVATMTAIAMITVMMMFLQGRQRGMLDQGMCSLE